MVAGICTHRPKAAPCETNRCSLLTSRTPGTLAHAWHRGAASGPSQRGVSSPRLLLHLALEPGEFRVNVVLKLDRLGPSVNLGRGGKLARRRRCLRCLGLPAA